MNEEIISEQYKKLVREEKDKELKKNTDAQKRIEESIRNYLGKR